MKKYTPGPWQYKPDLCKDDNVFAGEKRTANVFGAADTWYETEFEANARLIAAAPELLEACKTAMRILALWGGNDCPEENRALFMMQNAFEMAIKKAESGVPRQA